MSRTGGRYWESEQPVVVNISRLEVRFYPMAGVVQFYNRKLPQGEETPGRLSKGVSLHLDSLSPSELGQLTKTFSTIVQIETRYREVLKLQPPAAPVMMDRTLRDVMKELS